MSQQDLGHVAVVGAGPVGSVAALAARRAGFRVTLVETNPTVAEDPRASTFHPSTLEMLDDLGDGLFDEFVSLGLVARHFDFWDKPSGTLIARMDHQALGADTRFPYVVQTEQHKLARICLRRLEQDPGAEVLLGRSVTDVGQDDAVATLDLDDGSQVEADWVIACDGGRSTVRKALDIDFEGYTWPERFVVLTTLFDFEAALGCAKRSYFADPAEWTNLFKVAGEDGAGRWRVVFPTGVEESDEEALGDEAARRRLGALHPDAAEMLPVHRKIYRVHQRVAARFREGRVFLAGDAAHVNNPIGGLGLNTGIHDVTELIELLTAVSTGAETALLDRYERRRRTLNIRYVQEQTVANKRRLEEVDPQVRAEHLEDLRRTAEDPDRMRAFLRRTSLLDSVSDAREIE